MKRAGFTMIELIFVIVILGILSAVALPKFIGVSQQAHAAKCDSLVGTLNRTVLPAMWSNYVLNTPTTTVANSFTGALILKQIEIPMECQAGTGTASGGATNAPGTLTDTAANRTTIANAYATAITAGTAFYVVFGSGSDSIVYEVNASLPTTSVAPIISWTKK